jgi:predicted TPR repeat methyltransferase
VCASFWHAAVSGELGEVIDVPSAAPGDYVAKLFDGYADRFDDHLVNALGYQTPRLLMERVRGALAQGHSAASSVEGPLMFDHAMDLGCGTGLSGEALRPLVTGTFQTGMSRCWQIRQCIRALGLR